MRPQPLSGRPIILALGAVLAVAALAVGVFVGRGDRGVVAPAADGSTRTIAVQLADMRIVPSTVSVAPGTRLVLRVTDIDEMRHDLYIDGGPGTALLAHGQHARLDLGPITHPLQGWCTVPGHKAAGMTMTITVSGTG